MHFSVHTGDIVIYAEYLVYSPLFLLLLITSLTTNWPILMSLVLKMASSVSLKVFRFCCKRLMSELTGLQ